MATISPGGCCKPRTDRPPLLRHRGPREQLTDQQGRNTKVLYDGVGNRKMLTWPANTNGSSAYYVTYQYDEMNRMTEIDQNGSTSTPLAKYQWDSLSRQTLITYGDGTTDSYYSYDAGDNLQTLMQTYAGMNNSVTFSYGWQKNHQRASTGVSNGAFQYIPTVGTTSYGTANANNGYTTRIGGISWLPVMNSPKPLPHGPPINDM